jgi:hypothetical protein
VDQAVEQPAQDTAAAKAKGKAKATEPTLSPQAKAQLQEFDNFLLSLDSMNRTAPPTVVTSGDAMLMDDMQLPSPLLSGFYDDIPGTSPSRERDPDSDGVTLPAAKHLRAQAEVVPETEESQSQSQEKQAYGHVPRPLQASLSKDSLVGKMKPKSPVKASSSFKLRPIPIVQPEVFSAHLPSAVAPPLSHPSTEKDSIDQWSSPVKSTTPPAVPTADKGKGKASVLPNGRVSPSAMDVDEDPDSIREKGIAMANEAWKKRAQQHGFPEQPKRKLSEILSSKLMASSPF